MRRGDVGGGAFAQGSIAMLTTEQNERLTRVGPDTPCGKLLRRYWQALCPTSELTPASPTKRVRILGEDLVAYRTSNGRFACASEFCRHRGVSLAYGFVEADGIRCAYHGWKYAIDGRCIEQPFERRAAIPADVAITSYPVQTLGGLLFVYMGPEPSAAPLMPRWDVLAREDGDRRIQMFPTHDCNWLQIQENTVDSIHTYYLHGMMSRVHVSDAPGLEEYFRPIIDYRWNVCEWGIEKEIVYDDEIGTEVRPPLIFPNVLRIPQGPIDAMHFRVPIDDTHTRIIWIGFIPQTAGGVPTSNQSDVPFEYFAEVRDREPRYDLTTVYGQDQMAFETPGTIFDRTQETLGASDRGIVLFRRMLDEQINRVEAGLDPTVGVVPEADRERIIEFAATRFEGSLEMSLRSKAAR